MRRKTSKSKSPALTKLEFQRDIKRTEQRANMFRIIISLVGVLLITTSYNQIPIQEAHMSYLACGIVFLNAIMVNIFISTPNLIKSKLFQLIRYLSSFIDVFAISIIVWFLGTTEGHHAFKSHAYLGYFVYIALAAYRYSRALTLFTAFSSVTLYLGIFIIFLNRGLITLGTVEQEYLGPYVNINTMIIKITLMLLQAFVMSYTAKGYTNIIQKTVKLEVDYQKKKNEETQSLLRRYFSKGVADYIINTKRKLIGTRRFITIMFCDFRNFTKLSDNLPPDVVIQVLNKYLTEMVEIIFKYGGTLDKYMGDGFMAIFGAPLTSDDDTYRAVLAAIEIEKCVERINRESKDSHNLEIKMGINTGEAVAGNIGSEKRLEYTVIGSSVNLASRLERLNKKLDTTILISDKTYQVVRDSIKVRNCGRFKIRGINDPIRVYELLGVRDENINTMPNSQIEV